MAKTSYLRRNWKLILNIVTVGALVILAIAVREQLVRTFKNLANVNAWLLLLIIPIELANYHAQAKLYKSLFGVVGEKLSYRSMYRLAVELNFINHVFPSGGVTGISYFTLKLRSSNIRPAKSTVVQLMKLVLVFGSFEVLLIIGMLILASVGKANSIVILIGGSITTLLVVGTGLAIYVIGSRQRVQSFFRIMTKFVNKVIQIVRPRHPETISLERARPMVDELHDNYSLFRNRLQELKAPFWYAMLANLTEIAAVYVVYLAFGNLVNLGAVILAYAVANFAGLVSVLPGGVGVYEALMTGVLLIGGVPAAISIPATIMYRIANTLIQVPPGYYLYIKGLQRGGKKSGGSNAASR